MPTTFIVVHVVHCGSTMPLIKQMHCLSIPFTSAVVPLKFRNWKVIHPTFYQAHIYAEIELIGIENISHVSLQYDWLSLGPFCNLNVH